MTKKKPKKLSPKLLRQVQEEYQTTTTKLEDILPSNPKRNNPSNYLIQDPEKHPFSIYFSQHPQDHTPYTVYKVHIGKRLTPTNRLVGKKRMEEGKKDPPSDLELKKIEVSTPLLSSNTLPRNLASKLAIRLYHYLSDKQQPCEINYRTVSKFDRVFIEAEAIIFDNRKRYQSLNNKPKTTPKSSSARPAHLK